MPQTIIIELHNVPLFLCMTGIVAIAYGCVKGTQALKKGIKQCCK